MGSLDVIQTDYTLLKRVNTKMTRDYIDSLVKELYKFTTILSDLMGPGKFLDSSIDTVLILGGSSNVFGIEVTKTLIAEGVDVVNIDIVDHSELINSESVEEQVGRELSVPCNSPESKNKQRKRGKYHFIKCKSITEKTDVLEGLNIVLRRNYGITVFINNVNEGLFEFMQGSTDPRISYGPLDLKSKSFIIGNQAHFQDLLNSNLINVMISVKFFLNELIPQTMERFRYQGRSPGFYIINITNTISLHAPAFAGYYAASKAGLNQFHESLTSELGYYNSRRIKTLLTFLPFLSTHVVPEAPWPEYARSFVRGLKLGRSGEMTLAVVPGKFSYKHVLSMAYPTKFWRAYEPWWWEKLLIAIAQGYPHISNYIWPPRGVLGLASSGARHVN